MPKENWKNLVTGEDKNNRKFTQYVKSKTKSRTTVGPLVTKDKKILSEPKDMARELNNFFGSVFTQEDLTVIPEAEGRRSSKTCRQSQSASRTF
jgi:hypothetical protein